MAKNTLLFVSTFLLLAQVTYCNETTTRTARRPRPRIVGGSNAFRGEFPYQGVLEIENRVGTNTTYSICGCSLIHSRWAVTTAHCIKNKRASDLSLYFGRAHLSNIELPDHYLVLRIHRHPLYSSANALRYDIALLEINGGVRLNRYVSPILLPVSQGNPQVGQLCTITGWGSTLESNNIASEVLQKAEIPVVSNARCAQTFVQVFPEHLCAGYESGGVGICTGDGGAPLVCTSPAGNPILQGIGSFGSGCARPGIPSGYTRVSSFVDWIQTTTGSDEIGTDESTGSAP